MKDSTMAYSEQVKGFDGFGRSGYSHILRRLDRYSLADNPSYVNVGKGGICL